MRTESTIVSAIQSVRSAMATAVGGADLDGDGVAVESTEGGTTAGEAVAAGLGVGDADGGSEAAGVQPSNSGMARRSKSPRAPLIVAGYAREPGRDPIRPTFALPGAAVDHRG
jgi:hypothetical protein